MLPQHLLTSLDLYILNRTATHPMEVPALPRVPVNIYKARGFGGAGSMSLLGFAFALGRFSARLVHASLRHQVRLQPPTRGQYLSI